MTPNFWDAPHIGNGLHALEPRDIMFPMNAMITEYHTILSRVRRWPVEKRIASLEDVLRTLVPGEGPASIRPKDTFSKALGLLRTEKPSPTDEEVDAMLTEHRLEKYG